MQSQKVGRLGAGTPFCISDPTSFWLDFVGVEWDPVV